MWRFRGKHTEIAVKAIEGGWSTDKAELEVLRASRPVIGGAPALHVPDNAMDENILEAACILTAKLKQSDQLYEEKTLDAANKRFRGGIGLQELLLEVAWANGYTSRNFRNSREVLRFAFGYDLPGVQASGGGFSTVDISGILSNVANKFLLKGFFRFRHNCYGSIRDIGAHRAEVGVAVDRILQRGTPIVLKVSVASGPSAITVPLLVRVEVRMY